MRRQGLEREPVPQMFESLVQNPPQNADLFIRGGYGSTRLRASAPGVSVSDSEESWNYGAGGQYFFDANNGVRAEYTRHDFNHNAGSADAWAVSYVRKF